MALNSVFKFSTILKNKSRESLPNQANPCLRVQMKIKGIYSKRSHNWQLFHKLGTKFQMLFIQSCARTPEQSCACSQQQSPSSAHASDQPRVMETTNPPVLHSTKKYLGIHPAQGTGSDLHLHIVVSGGRDVLLGQIHSGYIRPWMCHSSCSSSWKHFSPSYIVL